MSATQIKNLLHGAAAEGLTEAADHVKKVAQERTPDDPATGGGDLRSSLTVDPATASSLESKVYTDSEYALYQHENLTLAHPTGQSKYLETAALDSRADVEQIIGAAVRRKLG